MGPSMCPPPGAQAPMQQAQQQPCPGQCGQPQQPACPQGCMQQQQQPMMQASMCPAMCGMPQQPACPQGCMMQQQMAQPMPMQTIMVTVDPSAAAPMQMV